MSMNPINGVEEVNIFKDDGAVIHIRQPKSKWFLIQLIDYPYLTNPDVKSFLF